MKSIYYFISGVFLIISCQTPETHISFSSCNWVDLSYVFDENTIYWPTSSEFELDTVSEGITEAGYYYSAFSFCMAEHGGTHLDAPVHFALGKQSVEQIELEKLIGDAVVIDVSAKVLNDSDYLVSVDDIQNWEETHGSISGKIVLLKSGFGRFWPDKVRYMGTDQRGAEAVPFLHFPGLAPKAAQWIVDNRNIKAIGIDTPSIDYGQSSLFEAHRILFEANIPAFENIANLDELPATGFQVIALPVKIKGGSGGPVRIIACLPTEL